MLDYQAITYCCLQVYKFTKKILSLDIIIINFLIFITMYLLQRRQILANKALEKFKELGYRVYYHQWEPDSKFSTCGYIRSKDGNSIGYWQVSDFAHGIRFGTVHKPCRECGTGYSLQMDDESIPVEEITTNHIEATFAFAPSWATKKQRAAIIKYQSFEEWVNSNTRCKTIEL